MMDGLGVSVVAGQSVRRVGWNGEAAVGGEGGGVYDKNHKSKDEE